MDDLSNALGKFLRVHEGNIEKMESVYKAQYAGLAKIVNDATVNERALTIAQNIDKTPQQTQKRTKRLNSINENDYKLSETNTQQSTRQTRASKMHANKKELSIKNQPKRNSKLLAVQVKQEKLSLDAIIPDNSVSSSLSESTSKSTRNNSKAKKQNDEHHPMEVDIVENETKALPNENEKSLVIISNDTKINLIEIESENEIMPPPNFRAPKTRKKKVENKLIESNVEDLIIKVEKDLGSSISEISSDSTLKSKTKKIKKQKIPKPMQIKIEKSFESVYEDASPLPIEAIALNMERLSMNQNKTESKIEEKTLDKISQPEITVEFPSTTDINKAVIDSTFLTANYNTAAHDVATGLADATFLTNPTNGDATFTTNSNVNATKIIDKNIDVTYNVVTNNNQIISEEKNIDQKNKYHTDSIMTDDDSDEADVPLLQLYKPKNASQNTMKSVPKYKPMPKSKLFKELFNPCIQSPVKKKVEAFEKAANQEDNKPEPIERQTRTKTRINEMKENKELNILSKPTNGTPNIGYQSKRLLTPQQTSNNTPSFGGTIKKMPNSTSKIIGLQKALCLNKVSVISSSSNSKTTTPSQSRDNSLDRAMGKLRAINDEKKKASTQKQQKAASIREIKEKERHDRLKKIMLEREEKARKILLEKEKLQAKIAKEKGFRIVEDINRNLKQLEEREQQRKLQEKQFQKDQAEIAKKEREMLENVKILKAKEQMQTKLEQNQKDLFKKNLILKQKLKDNGYNFDMIQTDDSTDEESVVKAKRPPIPDWSKEGNRLKPIQMQSNIPTEIIDNFFSVKPMTINLREIFPAIDPRDLKRNSSAIWNTPPRSQHNI